MSTWGTNNLDTNTAADSAGIDAMTQKETSTVIGSENATIGSFDEGLQILKNLPHFKPAVPVFQAEEPVNVMALAGTVYPPIELDSESEEEKEEEVTDESPFAVRTYLKNQDKLPKVFFAMATGVIDADGNNVGKMVLAAPYTEHRQKHLMQPTASALRAEVLRRWHLKPDPNAKKDPQPGRWTKTACINWLLEHPITDLHEINFIVQYEKRLRNDIIEANREAAMLNARGGNYLWTTETVCRMFESLRDDPNIKLAFINRYDADSIAVIDARNASNQEVSVFKLIADKMNNPDFNPDSTVDASMHEKFAEPMDLSKSGCMLRDVTEQDVRGKFADVKVKVMKVITNWEKSGNGDGNLIDADTWQERVVGDPNFGKFDRELYTSDHRSSYLLNYRAEVLYVWDLLDKCELLNTTLSTLSSEQSATVEGAPLTAVPGSNRKGKRKSTFSEEKAEERAKFLKTIEEFNVGQLLMAKSQLKKDLVHWKKEWALECSKEKENENTEFNPELKEIYAAMVTSTQKELDDLTKKLNGFNN